MLIRVQRVTAKHKKQCNACRKLPTDIRLLVESPGRSFLDSTAYCVECGMEMIDREINDLNKFKEELEKLNNPICKATATKDDLPYFRF